MKFNVYWFAFDKQIKKIVRIVNIKDDLLMIFLISVLFLLFVFEMFSHIISDGYGAY